jgi:hypothetical protein
MKRVLLTVAVALLIPGLLSAAPATLGVYFGGTLGADPAPFSAFTAELVLVQSDYFVTAVEYQLVVPDGNFVITGVSYPSNFAIENGSPLAGHSIAFWPPMTGYPDGYDVLATYECLTLEGCEAMPNYPLTVGPHPDSGELRGTFSPENATFGIIGLTTYLCSDGVANEDASWGAIKSLFE